MSKASGESTYLWFVKIDSEGGEVKLFIKYIPVQFATQKTTLKAQPTLNQFRLQPHLLRSQAHPLHHAVACQHR